MSIKTNASPNELDSPFFIRNEKFCKNFENFISENNGMTKGRYNAWSYDFYGKVKIENDWTLHYKKGTYSSGNLLLSTKYQNLLVLIEWTCHKIESLGSDFIIRKRELTDLYKLSFFKKYIKLNISDKYIIIPEKEKVNDKINQIINTLKPLFQKEEIYKISYKKDELKIELRTENQYFDIFKKLDRTIKN